MARELSSGATIVDFPGTHRTLSPTAIEWLGAERKLSPETLAKLPVASGAAYFPDLNRKSEGVFFQYPDGWKARSFPEKAFTSKPGTTATFWNLANVLEAAPEEVYIVEGELDACALVESEVDFNTVLAAPGASSNLEYVEQALAAGLNKVRRFVWCGDQDPPGLELRKGMARILGAAKFNFIEWPEGSKDANDFMKSDGPEAVRDRVKFGFTPWPTAGLFKLSDIPDSPALERWYPGFEAWGDKMFLAPGTLSVATGHPGMGKTMLWTQIWQQVVKAHNLVICVASFETRPKPHIRRQLRALHSRVLERHMSAAQIAAADQWIDEHYRFLIHPERRPTMQWLLNEAEVAVVRSGAKILQIDPWNRLEASREARESETDYIARCLREIYNFAVDFNCHVQILAHPSKVDSMRRGEPPELEDIAGSKHWDNMVDQGFVVHRPQLFDEKGNREVYAELHHKKARFDELGYATKFGLDYDVDFGRYGTRELKQKRKRKTEDKDDE